MFPEDRALGQILLQGNSAYGRAQWGWGPPGLNPGEGRAQDRAPHRAAWGPGIQVFTIYGLSPTVLFFHHWGTFRLTNSCSIHSGDSCAVVIRNEDTCVCVFVFVNTDVKNVQGLR